MRSKFSISRLRSRQVFNFQSLDFARDRFSNGWWILFGVCLVHVFILSKLIFFPYPELFVYPYLTNHGLLPYKQIFDQHFPGLLFLPINFGILGLTNEYSARIWQYLAVISTQLLLYLISLKVLKSSAQALAISVLYLLWQPFFQGWMLWTNNFLALIYLPAFYFGYLIISGKKGGVNFFWLGLFFGLAVLFKQVALPLAGIVFLYLFFLNRFWKSLIFFGVGISIPLLGLLIWLNWLGVMADFWFWTIQFNLTTYARLGGKKPEVAEITRWLRVYLPSGLIFLHKVDSQYKVVILLAIFIWGGIFGGGNRFDFTYFQPSLPFVCLASVWGMTILFKKFYRLGLTFVLLYLVMSGALLLQFYKGTVGPKVYYFDRDIKAVGDKIKQLTIPGEEIFVFGATPLLYQMTETVPAGRVFVFQFPWFLVDAGDKIYQGLKESDPRLIISDSTVTTDNQKITDFAPVIANYIYSNYHVIEKIGTIEIMEKN